jgi:ribosomal protein S18 acetylase RimI-like enzyme
MKIEPAVLEDALAIAEIHVLAWQAAYADILSADYLASLSVASREKMWRDSIVRGVPEILVARVQGRMVGWLALGPSRDEGSEPGTGEVFALYVAPDHWSSGAGRQLWLRGRHRLSQLGYRVATLWVLVDNARALRFYAAAGFVPEPDTVKEFDLGGRLVKEIRYVAKLSD